MVLPLARAFDSCCGFCTCYWSPYRPVGRPPLDRDSMNLPTNLEGPLLMTKEGQSWSTRAIDAKNRADFISASLCGVFVLFRSSVVEWALYLPTSTTAVANRAGGKRWYGVSFSCTMPLFSKTRQMPNAISCVQSSEWSRKPEQRSETAPINAPINYNNRRKSACCIQQCTTTHLQQCKSTRTAYSSVLGDWTRGMD